MTFGAPLLETRGLTKRFGNFSANSDIDFSVAPGELRAVIGPNGAGKTTFFNMLAGTTSISDGVLTFKGRAITQTAGPARVALGIAKAFQTANIYPEQTVLQNCRLAALAKRQGQFSFEFFRPSKRLSDIDETAAEALDLLHLGDIAQLRAGDLSHGDKKRLDIAIALATKPDVLLLDEPVAGMALEEVHKTGALIKALAKRMTVLLIEHDMDMIMGISDSITVLYQGRVLAQGTPAEIRANTTVQEAYLGGHVDEAQALEHEIESL
jgi:ABC-type branched-subunit amino acid transport system ATPase component